MGSSTAGVCWNRVGHLCPSESRAFASPAWGDTQSALPMGREPAPAVSFGEEHLVPSHASESSVYQTATSDREPLWAQAGWGQGERAEAEAVTEVRARLPQCDTGVMHSSTGLGSPLLSASHCPPTGGHWTPGCPWCWQLWVSALPLGHAGLNLSPADDHRHQEWCGQQD